MNQLTRFVLLACAGMTMRGQDAAPGLSLSQQLPTATRIDVRQEGKWTRGVVSEDEGPRAARIKVRVGPESTFMIVPRDSIRLAARPAHIAVGDHFEWYDSSVFKYVPAFVKGIGSGSLAGWYLMAYDSNPNSRGMYSKPDKLFVPLLANDTAPPGASGAGGNMPELGKYRCYAYSTAKAPPIFLGEIDLRAGGSYSGHNLEGRYSYDAASRTLSWTSGWMKDNQFGGKLESNAVIRIARTSICTHE